MSITSLQIDFDEINRRIAQELNFSAGFLLAPAADQVKCSDLRRAGLAKFYSAYQWSFLRPEFVLSTTAEYKIGTVTISNGVATLSGGTWPAYADNCWLYIGGVPYTVNSRSSNSVILLANLTLEASAGTAFSMRQFYYPISNGQQFAGLDGPLWYSPGETNRMKSLKSTSDQLIRRYYQQSYWGNTGCGVPTHYSLVYESEDSTVGQEPAIALWPPADRAYHITGRRNVVPKDLDATNKYPAGGALHRSTILAAIMSEVVMGYNGSEGEWGVKYAVELAKSIANDKRISSPDGLGAIPDYSGWDGGSVNLDNSGDFWLVPEGMDDQIIP